MVKLNFCGEDSKLELVLRLKGTVILKIWKQLVFITVYTSVIVVLQTFVSGFQMGFPQTLIPVLAVVTGLLLVFRTNTAYDRYWEGRRLWSFMTQQIRQITRLIWVGVREPSVKEVIEKKTAINILIAFAYATKNYLRDEYSYESDDIRDLIKHLPKFSTPSAHASLDSQQTKGTANGSNGTAHTLRERFGTSFKVKESNYRAHDVITPTNIPLELSYCIASYFESVRARGICDPSLLVTMTKALGRLMSCLTGFERILRTPIPLAYSVHLHHSIWLYLLALPYQLVGVLSWWTVPAVALASFSLLGILEIGWEIENPFGYDDNDLPLDDFCKVLRREIQGITGHALPPAETWLWSSENQPYMPGSSLTAAQLAEMSMMENREMLTKLNNIACKENDQDCTKPENKKFSSLLNLFHRINNDSTNV